MSDIDIELDGDGLTTDNQIVNYNINNEDVEYNIDIADNDINVELGTNEVNVEFNIIETGVTDRPSNFTQSFNATTDWGAASGGYYTITVTHNLGSTGVICAIYDTTTNEDYVLTDLLRIVDENTLSFRVPETPDTRFAGKIVVSSKQITNDHGTLTGLSDDDHTQYHNSTRANSWLATKTTDNLDEGSENLYFTNSRFDTRLATKSTTNLAEGTNLYWTNSRFDTRLATKTTSNLTEGSNLYYTNARVLAYHNTLTGSHVTNGDSHDHSGGDGATIPINGGGTGKTTQQTAINALTAVSGADENQVLTKDSDGNATWQDSQGGLSDVIVGNGVTEPASPSAGQMFINSVTNTLKIYWGGAWQTLHTFGEVVYNYLLQENGDFLLQENGDKIALET